MKTQNSKLKTQNHLKREFSAGGIVFRKRKAKSEKRKVVFLLGKHSGYHKWALPKGLIEKDERSWQTAIRETEEEAGIKAKLATQIPIHKITYFYWADLKDKHKKQNARQGRGSLPATKVDRSTRRVEKYQEEGGGKTKVLKTVTFYLLQYISGDPKNHGWEMEEAGWFSYEQALVMMGFAGEKEALKKAKQALE